jgi:hypothetical protein
MEIKVNVPMQALSTPLIVLAVVAACGERAALGLLVVAGVGAIVWLACAAQYAIRRSAAAGDHDGDARALATGLVGLLVPVAGMAAIWQTSSFTGLLFSSEAAAFGGVALAVIPVAILTSSMMDHYVILPFCYGQFGPPIWSMGTEPSEDRRRRYAKVWVAHRTICEICCYVALAILLAIIFVAAGNVVSHERVLAVALESLGGSGVAFTVLAYLGPRVRDGWNYMLAESAGLGTWADGIDNRGEQVEGLVVDVSIHPGVKLRTEKDQWTFVPLAPPRLHEIQSRRPAKCDEAWARQAFGKREEAKPHERPRDDERSG